MTRRDTAAERRELARQVHVLGLSSSSMRTLRVYTKLGKLRRMLRRHEARQAERTIC